MAVESGGDDKSILEEDIPVVDDEDAAYFFGLLALGPSSSLSRDWLLFGQSEFEGHVLQQQVFNFNGH